MSIAERFGVQVFEAGFLLAFLLLPIVAFRGELENYFFGVLVLYMCLRVIRGRLKKKLDPKRKAVFISGCDSGFGQASAFRLSEKGYRVFAGCLCPDGEGATKLRDVSNVHVVPLDVTSDESVVTARDYVTSNLGDHELWSIVNNAGIYCHGDVELCRLDVFKMAAEVNVFGLIRVTQAFLPLLRKCQGRVVNMSSINGRYNWPSAGPYCMSKAAVESVSDCLRLEMVKFGVKVSIIEPAMFGGSTNLHGEENSQRYYREMDRTWEACSDEVREAYSKEYLKNQIDLIVQMRFQLSAKTPDAVVDAVEDAVTSSHPKYRYIVHGGPMPIDPLALYGTVYGLLPEFVTDWIACKVTKTDSLAILGTTEGSPSPSS